MNIWIFMFLILMFCAMILFSKNNFTLLIILDMILILVLLNIIMNINMFFSLFMIFIMVFSCIMGINLMILNSSVKMNFETKFYKD